MQASHMETQSSAGQCLSWSVVEVDPVCGIVVRDKGSRKVGHTSLFEELHRLETQQGETPNKAVLTPSGCSCFPSIYVLFLIS